MENRTFKTAKQPYRSIFFVYSFIDYNILEKENNIEYQSVRGVSRDK